MQKVFETMHATRPASEHKAHLEFVLVTNHAQRAALSPHVGCCRTAKRSGCAPELRSDRLWWRSLSGRGPGWGPPRGQSRSRSSSIGCVRALEASAGEAVLRSLLCVFINQDIRSRPGQEGPCMCSMQPMSALRKTSLWRKSNGSRSSNSASISISEVKLRRGCHGKGIYC